VLRVEPTSLFIPIRPAADHVGRVRHDHAILPCARVGHHGYPEWVCRGVPGLLPVRPAFDEYLASTNLATARAAMEATAPIPFSRWIERANREDRFRPTPADGERKRTEPDAEKVRPSALASIDHPPRLGEVAPLPRIERVEQVKRAYSMTTLLPRGMTLDGLA
jgi:hypothetical protein